MGGGVDGDTDRVDGGRAVGSGLSSVEARLAAAEDWTGGWAFADAVSDISEDVVAGTGDMAEGWDGLDRVLSSTW